LINALPQSLPDMAQMHFVDVATHAPRQVVLSATARIIRAGRCLRAGRASPKLCTRTPADHRHGCNAELATSGCAPPPGRPSSSGARHDDMHLHASYITVAIVWLRCWLLDCNQEAAKAAAVGAPLLPPPASHSSFICITQ
jgi:hypothetical protein